MLLEELELELRFDTYDYQGAPMLCARFVREFFNFQTDFIVFRISLHLFEGCMPVEIRVGPSQMYLYWNAVPMPLSWSKFEDMYPQMRSWLNVIIPGRMQVDVKRTVYVQARPALKGLQFREAGG